MKKFILFFVLILGFISEGKAQFAASSEIHYYLNTETYNGKYSCMIVKFCNNKILSYWTSLDPSEDSPFEYIDNKIIPIYLEETDAYIYNHKASTNRYYAYKIKNDYSFFSIDKKELISFNAYFNTKNYYRTVSRAELEELLKPNFDFLE